MKKEQIADKEFDLIVRTIAEDFKKTCDAEYDGCSIAELFKIQWFERADFIDEFTFILEENGLGKYIVSDDCDIETECGEYTVMKIAKAVKAYKVK